MYSSKSKLQTVTCDCVRHCCTCSALRCTCYHGLRSVFFCDFIHDCDQKRMYVHYRSFWAVALAFVRGVFVSVRFEVEVRGGGVRSRKGSEIVFPCLKQNNLCVIISMLIVCWGSVIPRSGLRVFCVGWGKDVDEETSSCVCVCSCATLITGTSGSSVPGNFTMSLKHLWEGRHDAVCMGWY